MRMLTLLFTTMFLHGCATAYVLKKAQGYSFFPSDVESARFDDAQKEFVLCLIDRSSSQQEDSSRFTIKIPQDIIIKGGNDRFKLSDPRIIYGKVKDILWYELSTKFLATNAKVGCNVALNSLEDMEILRVPNDISADEALLLKGEAINGMLTKKKPFLIYVPANLIPEKFRNNSYISCQAYPHSCLMLVVLKALCDSTYQECKGDQKIAFTVILTIGELTRTGQPKLEWYLAMPFSIALDATFASIVAVFVLIDVYTFR